MYKVSRFSVYLILAVALFLHLTVLNHIRIFGARPDLMLVFVIFFGVFLGAARGLETGLVAGFLQDLFALDYFGINAFIFATVGFLAGILSRAVIKESKMTQWLLVFFLTIFALVLHFAVVSRLSKLYNLSMSELFLASMLPAAIYTSLISIPIFSKFTDIYNLKDSQELL